MEEAPENSKELSHSARANGMNKISHWNIIYVCSGWLRSEWESEFCCLREGYETWQANPYPDYVENMASS